MRTKLIVIASLLTPAWAHAEPPRSPDPAPVTYGFDDEVVQGDFARSDLEILHTRRGAHRRSLIEVRTSYVRELLKSVEDL